MPGSGTLCKKCRSGLAVENDSWCLLCSCAQELNEASKHRFASLALRSLAEEITLQTSRQIQGLIQIDRQVNSERTSLSDRLHNAKTKLAEVTNQVDKSAQPKSASVRPGAAGDSKEPPVKAEKAEREESNKAPASEADFDEESFEEESEEEPGTPDRPAAPETAAKRSEQPRSPSRPPLPRCPPPEQPKRKRKRDRSRDRGRRGGSRHQQVYRGLSYPDQTFPRPYRAEPINLGGETPRHRTRQ